MYAFPSCGMRLVCNMYVRTYTWPHCGVMLSHYGIYAHAYYIITITADSKLCCNNHNAIDNHAVLTSLMQREIKFCILLLGSVKFNIFVVSFE